MGYIENEEDKKFIAPNVINKEKAYILMEKYNDVNKVEKAFKEVNSYWNNLLDKFKVETPNEPFNRMVNIWNQYQCMTTYCMINNEIHQ